MADEKGKVTEKNQDPNPRTPATLPDELPDAEIDTVSGGHDLRTGPIKDSY